MCKMNKKTGAKKMSTNINANILKNFIVKTIGSNHLTERQAKKVGIDSDKYSEANIDDNNYLELDEILDDTELYAKFATMYDEEKEKEAKVDKEKEKEEQAKVKDKNGAGV